MEIDPIVEILREQLAGRQAGNASYSLRSYARDLDIDASNLSKILSYKKPLGHKLRKEMAKKVGCSPLNDRLTNEKKIDDSDYESHSLDVFRIVSSWQYYAILELSKLPGIQINSKTVSKQLGITPELAQTSISKLKKLGLLTPNESGSLKCSTDSSSSILETATSQAQRNQQKQILEKAIEALEKTPVENRSQSSMTVAIDSERLDEAKKKIAHFRRGLSRFLSQGDSLNSVYHLSISLYPVTNQK